MEDYMQMTRGTPIPSFSATTSHGRRLGSTALVDVVSEVLVFVPDVTDSLSLQLVAALDRRMPEFGHRTSQLLVVAKVAADEAVRFVQAQGYTITVLADPDGRIAESFGYDPSDGLGWVVADEHGIVVTSGSEALSGSSDFADAFVDRLVNELDRIPAAGTPATDSEMPVAAAPEAPRDDAPRGHSVVEVIGWATGDRKVEAAGVASASGVPAAPESREQILHDVRKEHGDVQGS